MTDKKEIKVNFAPGCFDNFEGTQEELDALQEEILSMFANMTPEEIEKRSIPLDLEEELANDPEFAQYLSGLENRTLQ